MSFSAIILAAGSGKRTGLKYNKVLYEIHEKRILDYSIDTMKKFPIISEIILVVAQEEYDFFLKEYEDVVDIIVVGGAERQDSVYQALNKAKGDYVITHDGARPFIPLKAFKHMFELVSQYRSVTMGVLVKDTIQEVDGNRVVKTLNRSKLIATQTPQAFEKKLLLDAHIKARQDHYIGTDDTGLIEKYYQISAYYVTGDYRNIKLTTLDDINLLEVIL